MRLRRGILAQADRNLLYVDEINLLQDEVVDAILDAAAQGAYTVRRGPVSATYRARFVLIGSMNPEEGRLRPQIMDRLGLRVVVRGLEAHADRLEAYRRVKAYLSVPQQVISQYAPEIELARQEVQSTRDLLAEVNLPDDVAQQGLEMISSLKIDSLRAEITLFEAARALAALDGRQAVVAQDLLEVASMALRLRRSFMDQYFDNQAEEENELTRLVQRTIPPQA
jgi:magnesium chelatase subunit I